jgi:CHAT domain-containing protein
MLFFNIENYMKQKAYTTETNLNTYGSQYSFIHLAGHGTFDLDKPINSALLLTRDRDNDSPLRAGGLCVDR